MCFSGEKKTERSFYKALKKPDDSFVGRTYQPQFMDAETAAAAWRGTPYIIMQNNYLQPTYRYFSWIMLQAGYWAIAEIGILWKWGKLFKLAWSKNKKDSALKKWRNWNRKGFKTELEWDYMEPEGRHAKRRPVSTSTKNCLSNKSWKKIKDFWGLHSAGTEGPGNLKI